MKMNKSKIIGYTLLVLMCAFVVFAYVPRESSSIKAAKAIEIVVTDYSFELISTDVAAARIDSIGRANDYPSEAQEDVDRYQMYVKNNMDLAKASYDQYMKSISLSLKFLEAEDARLKADYLKNRGN